MSRADLQDRASDLRTRRIPYVHARVVLAQRPTSAKPGDEALIFADGSMEGFVGGSCAESTVRAQSLTLPYVGLVASRRRGAAVLDELAEARPDLATRARSQVHPGGAGHRRAHGARGRAVHPGRDHRDPAGIDGQPGGAAGEHRPTRGTG